MIQLSKHSLTQTGSFLVETESLTLAEKDSSVTFTVALPGDETSAPLPQAPNLTVGDWLMEDTEPGKGIVWRVKSIEDDYSKRTRTVTAEHIIQILKDTCIFGEKTPEDMGGSETMVDAQHAIQFALGAQSDWVLGTFTYTDVSAGYTFNSDSVLEAINTVSTTLQDCWWSYKLDVYPFQLNIQPKANTASCEMRMSRNITTIKRSLDASQLYTRIFPIGKDDLHLTETYLSKNTNIYGVIHKVETNQSLESETELRAWAQERLNRHSEPNLTISVTGLELSDATGEPMDHLAPGRLCQVPLPEYSTVITETITKMVWKDKLKEPMAVTVTMANQPVDLATIIKEQNDTNTGGSGSGGRKAGSSSKKKKEEDHAWFVDTTDHVAMVAEAVAGEGAASDWSRVAEVMVDGEGVHQRVTRTEGDLVTAEGKIDVLEDQIDLKVAKGDVSTQLSVECGNVHITGTPGAANLVVDGYVTATGLEASIAELSVVRVKSIQAEGTAANLSLPTVTAQSSLYVGTGVGSVELISNGITDAITDLNISLNSSTNVYTLQKKTVKSHASWTDVDTFSRATTLSVAYGGDNTGDTATVTVSASPQGNSATGSLVVHQNKNAAWITDPGGTIRARINNPQYGNGWAAAYGEVDLPTTSSTYEYFIVKTPKSSTDGGANTETYTMSSSTNNIAVTKNSAGTVVARLEHKKYDAGFDAVGSPAVTWPSAATGQSKDDIAITHSVDNKKTGEERSRTIHLSLNTSTYTSGGVSRPCVNLHALANQSGRVIGRIDCGDIHNAGGLAAWLYYQNGSSWVRITSAATIDYSQTVRVRYKAANGNYANVTDAVFYTKEDRYQEGYDDGAASVTHSPTASATFPWTGSIGGRTSLGSVSYSSLHNSYILIDAKCGGYTTGYYITVN